MEWKNIGELSTEAIRNILKTRVRLPSDWRINDNGMIDPECFCNLNRTNLIFKSPLRYIYFLSRKLEGKIDLDAAQGSRTFIPDKELRPIVGKIAAELFRTKDIKSLNVNDRLILAKKLRREYVSTAKQISRRLYLDAEILKGFI